MTAPRVLGLWRAARRRREAITWLQALPWLLLAVAAATRWLRPAGTWPVLALAALATAGIALARARALDRRWLVRALDAHRDLEDSADLLFADAATLGPLQRLQRERVLARLERGGHDLRQPWPWRRLAGLGMPALLMAALVLGWPTAPGSPAAADPLTGASAAAAPIRLQQARLRVTPPAYTGLPAQDLPGLDARQPQGTLLDWSLRLAPQPGTVALRLADGQQLPLQLRDGVWGLQLPLRQSTLYRLLVDGQPLDRALHKLEALPDRAPQVRVVEPTENLVMLSPGQRDWSLRFEATDDYGVDSAARLKITLAQGSGENIRFSERSLAVRGDGPPRQRRFLARLQPQALGMGPGDDLVVQLQVLDNRQPQPQAAASPSVILRWPPPQPPQASDLEGSVKQTLPAYFRSQRQIIIDAEALLKEQPRLAAETFLKRSDAIGVDQRLLRLRYGQFLGEETEGAPQAPPLAEAPAAPPAPAIDLPTADMPTGDAPTPAPAATPTPTAPPAAQGAAALDDHDHDHPTPATFGAEGDVLAEFGHVHDHAEAATLLDPQTRATLKSALDQMWQAEGELRQGRPRQALPYAYKALDYIKQVQQAERIYLARTGPQLPPIDESRRMGGKRDGLASRPAPLAARTPPDPRVSRLWQALAPQAGGDDRSRAQALADFGQWLGQHSGELDDGLDLAAAVETLRADPACQDCQRQLRARLWPLLARPPAAPQPRPRADARGQRYLDALQDPEVR